MDALISIASFGATRRCPARRRSGSSRRRRRNSAPTDRHEETSTERPVDRDGPFEHRWTRTYIPLAMMPTPAPSEDVAPELPAGPCVVVGQGRMGTAIASALAVAGVPVRGPLGRGETAAGAALVLLCVPDREIAAAASVIQPGPVVGHVSASAPLGLLAPHERFSLHPLLSVVGAGASFRGAYCAVEGSSAAAIGAARALAERLGMHVKLVP